SYRLSHRRRRFCVLGNYENNSRRNTWIAQANLAPCGGLGSTKEPRAPSAYRGGAGWALPTACAARHPVCRSFLAVTLRVRYLAVEREGVARQQVPDIVPDGQPHLTLNNTRPQREWVSMRLENRPCGPPSLQNLIESLGTRVCFECLKGNLIHWNPP